MAKKKNKKPAPYLHNVYEDKQSTGALSMYKQGGFATDYVIETKNFGLSTIASKYLKTLLGSFTLSNFPALSPEEEPFGVKLHKEETFGELSKFIPHVPQKVFNSKNDIIRLMKDAHREEGEVSGRDREDFEEAMQELQQKVNRTFSYSEKGSSNTIIKRSFTTDTPFLNFNTIQYKEEIEDSSGAQQLLFERTGYVLSITHPILLMGIEEKSSMSLNYSLLPIDSGALLESTKDRLSLEKRERALLDYVGWFYDRKIAPYSHQKNKRRTVFTEEELIVGVMGIKKEAYLGTNRSRKLKELTQALEKLKGTRFVEKTEHLKDTKEVAIYWNLKA